MEEKIYIFKLISGEEVISKIKPSKDEQIFELDNPRILGIHPKEGLRLVPLMMMADESQQITLMKSAVTSFSQNIQEEIEQAYCEETSSIITPRKKILMS